MDCSTMSALEFYNVNTNLLKLYQPSTEAKHILNEHDRSLKAERPWTSNNAASLVDLTLQVIAFNFIDFAAFFNSKIFSNTQRAKLIFILPTDLPLEITSTTIPDGIFWKRCCFNHWDAGLMLQYRDSWKNLYMEILLQTYIENASPNNINLMELIELINLVKEYVKVLNIEQLQVTEMPENAACLIKHIDLRPILLPLVHLNELSIRARVRNAAMQSTQNIFELTNTDCSNIAGGLEKSKNLKMFKIHQTLLDRNKLKIICTTLASIPSLECIEFTSCGISDDAIITISETINSYTSLKKLILTNNKIGPTGCESLATVLPAIQLHTLDLRLNFIEDKGARALFTSIRMHPTLRTLILSACKITHTSIQDLALLISTNRRITHLDLNCNSLEEASGSEIIGALKKNQTLHKLSLRQNGITSQQKELIDSILTTNSKLNKIHV